MIHSAFRLEVLDLTPDQLAETQVHNGAIFGRQDIGIRKTQDSVRFPAEHRLVGAIGVEDPAVNADKGHADRRALRDLA
jgi:hypothetical protein